MENLDPQVMDQGPLEEVYQKKTQLEHILLRPDTYIGSMERETQMMWVFDDISERLAQRNVCFVPGLYKIFDEILVNAADNRQRDRSMNKLKVEIDEQSGTISVFNNGKGIPVEVHRKENVYIPELIFGHLLTSSNYNDQQKKTTGGRNGYGAKLTNIFSTEFTIETVDSERRLRYKQVWRKNMSEKSDPSIRECDDEDWTKVTFKPDFGKFGMLGFDEDILALLKKRVYDIAGTTPSDLKVYFNGKALKVSSFKSYVEMYVGPRGDSEDSDASRPIFDRPNDRWEIAILPSDGHFEQVSFVNNICTYKGGTHVNMVAAQVADALVAHIKKKEKAAKDLKTTHVKNHMWVFVNALIENPAFDSQTKATLTLNAKSFGSTCVLGEKAVKQVLKSAIVENILSWSKFKQSKDLKKTDGKKLSRLTHIEKLEDANNAGGRRASECTLILTEGDSAKALAVSGLSVVGRDLFGVFPLKGKLLNVRDATSKQLNDNEEITNIKKILGLKHGVDYKDTNSLRYGHVMLMTDQDHDGSHIKGLIINLFHCFWPSLLQIPGFVREFVTPIVKCTKGKKTVSFYTIPEYQTWKSENNAGRGWTIKYYKGLGTNTAKEGKEYFANIEEHQIDFVYEGKAADQSIELAFGKKNADARKEWLAQYQPGTFLDMHVPQICFSDFVNKEFILYSRASNERAIPSAIDGFKPGQRKILFSCFKRKLIKEMKVAQLSGYVAADSAYHHGESALNETITKLAQNFVGSNNINLLIPSGQFGTRHQGGKDCASPRYIFTYLAPLARALFHPDDDAVLTYNEDDGHPIEPEWYMPVLPMVLVNGSSGVGTGWSSNVPNFNPQDIVRNIYNLLDGQPQTPLHPWYKGFKGTIEPKKNGSSYTVTGCIEKIDDTHLRITELPLGKTTSEYKPFLETMVDSGFIKDIREHHTDTDVCFQLELTPENMALAESEGLHKKFKLTGSLATTNMVLFDYEGKLQKYSSANQILEAFFGLRLEFYDKRKKHMISTMEGDLKRLENKVRFILAVIADELKIRKIKKNVIIANLIRDGYDPIPKSSKKPHSVENENDDSDKEENKDEEEEMSDASKSHGIKSSDYDYLLSMPLWSLTLERVEALQQERDSKRGELDALRRTAIQDIWKRDLDAVLAAIEEHEAAEKASEKEAATITRKKGGPKSRSKAVVPKRPKKDDSDEEFTLKSTSTAPSQKPIIKSTTLAVPAPAPIPAVAAATTKTATVAAHGRKEDFKAAAPVEAKEKQAKTKPKAQRQTALQEYLERNSDSDDYSPSAQSEGENDDWFNSKQGKEEVKGAARSARTRKQVNYMDLVSDDDDGGGDKQPEDDDDEEEWEEKKGASDAESDSGDEAEWDPDEQSKGKQSKNSKSLKVPQQKVQARQEKKEVVNPPRAAQAQKKMAERILDDDSADEEEDITNLSLSQRLASRIKTGTSTTSALASLCVGDGEAAAETKTKQIGPQGGNAKPAESHPVGAFSSDIDLTGNRGANLTATKSAPKRTHASKKAMESAQSQQPPASTDTPQAKRQRKPAKPAATKAIKPKKAQAAAETESAATEASRSVRQRKPVNYIELDGASSDDEERASADEEEAESEYEEENDDSDYED